jgi:Flp pilus assembly protein TadG
MKRKFGTRLFGGGFDPELRKMKRDRMKPNGSEMISGPDVKRHCEQCHAQPSFASWLATPSVWAQRSGQAAVEFALVLIVAMIVLFVAIQMAVIGQAALALGQMNYQGARYAAIYTTCVDAKTSTCGPNNQTIQAYMVSVASPTITKLGAGALTVNYCTTPQGTTTCLNSGSARGFGDSVTISCTLNVNGLLFLSNPFLGVSFPTTLNSSETALSE